jgi:hypothetical protein
VEAPPARHSRELALAEVVEFERRSGDEIADRSRDDDVSGACRGQHTRPDVDGEAGELSVRSLALAGVDAGTELEAELARRLHDRPAARDRPRGAVERREEAVPCGIELGAAVSRQFAPDDPPVLLQERAPRRGRRAPPPAASNRRGR